MAKATKTPVKAAARNVLADLIGNTPAKGKATPVKATPVKATPVKATPVKATPVKATPVKATPVKATPVKSRTPDTAKIKIVEAPGHREHSNCAFIRDLIKNGMTVAAYRAAREKLQKNPHTKEPMPGSGMAYLGGLARAGKIKLIN